MLCICCSRAITVEPVAGYAVIAVMAVVSGAVFPAMGVAIVGALMQMVTERGGHALAAMVQVEKGKTILLT